MNESRTHACDVAIIGGGPSGSTLATLLRKYNPALSVLVIEKETFPREHVGESQLPAISPILWEMGVWDKVEAAGFPVKLGASLTWGRDNERWDFDFYPVEEFKDEPRPAKFEGQRTRTAFQVERSIYDTILLDHAAEQGADVRQGALVREILKTGDRVDGLHMDNGDTIVARYYVDASGTHATLRRAMGVDVDAPHSLRNVAFWSYWDNIQWAVEIGVGGTRVQVRSLPYGWIWFIPLSPTRASVGLICPAEYYKNTGLSPEEIYHKALSEQQEIASLMTESAQTDKVHAAKDWSQVAHRVTGDNWYVCGEAAGFADPILAAGMTLAHGSARELAYTILEMERGELDKAWLKRSYDEKTRKNIRQHIRFAQFWYASNGCFKDLQEHCQNIAQEAGLQLNPQEAWRWLAQGGFSNQTLDAAHLGSFDLGTAKQLVGKFGDAELDLEKETLTFMQYNKLTLDFRNVRDDKVAEYREGRVVPVDCVVRDGKILPKVGAYPVLVNMLAKSNDPNQIFGYLQQQIRGGQTPERATMLMRQLVQAMEVMVVDGWVICENDPNRPMPKWTLGKNRQLRSSDEGERAYESARGARMN
ncbi:MAG: tryptophan 7-halogenase [Phycisphaeraceae bacterium]|nr:tryptophan 7-halogenase [Phycisphaeraceae bacterium]